MRLASTVTDQQPAARRPHSPGAMALLRTGAMSMDSYDVLPRHGAWTADAPPQAGAGADEAVFTIGELAQEFGLTMRALRFYESRGFLAPRRAGPSRLYGQWDHDRIVLILKAKKLGFTLREIGDLIATRSGDADPSSLELSRRQCTEQINLLERQKRDIETALAELRRAYSSHYLRALDRDER
ncbi:MAG: hypothetical protein QOC56_817 [Alphaproteobacteria bacterium]|nr:hypothetical protein [Alphaproteobacteria bacterium]